MKAGRLRGPPRLNSRSDRSARPAPSPRPGAMPTYPGADGFCRSGAWPAGLAAPSMTSEPSTGAFSWLTRLAAVRRAWDALNSACQSLVAFRSPHPKIRANHLMFSRLTPFRLSWNHSWTVRKSTPLRFASICEIASARRSGVQGPSGNPSASTGRPAPAAASRRNKALKSS